MKTIPALAAVLALLVSGCSAEADSDELSVVAAFYPLEYVADRVVGDLAEVTSLASPGAEPHDAELTVSQTAEVVDADVVVHLSGFQPAVDDAVTLAEEAEVVDAADAAELVPAGEDTHDDHGEDGEEHAGEPTDPHFWVDPTRLAAVTGEVADALATVDPDNAETYSANAEELEQELLELDQEITEGLQDCVRDSVVVSHDAFGYFGERYGLELYPIAGLSPDSEPSPAHLAELQELIEAQGITTVFYETLASPAMAETLSSDLGLETAVLDPIEGLSDETADEDYFSLMRNNLAALQQANGCG